MKRLTLISLFLTLALPAYASVNLKCEFNESYKVLRGKTERTYNDKVVEVKGNLDKEEGTIKIKSPFLFGTTSYQEVKLNRSYRKNEGSLNFKKYHNKTMVQVERKTWLPKYVRFSIPKRFNGKKSFPAYLGYFVSAEDHSAQNQQQAQQTVSGEEQEEFERENVSEMEFKMSCKLTKY